MPVFGADPADKLGQEVDAVKGFTQQPGSRWRLAWPAMAGLLVLLLASGIRHVPVATAQAVGTISVQKQLQDAQGNPVTGDLSGWTFNVSGPGGTFSMTTNAQGMATIGVAPGTYTITEQPRAGAQLVGFFIGNTPIASFQVVAGQTTSITAINRVAGTAAIQISKQIVDATGAVIPTADRSGFQFTITGPGGFSQTVTTDAVGNASLTNLAQGTYTVTEQPRSGYQLVTLMVNNVQVPNGASFTVTAGSTVPIVAQNRAATTGTITFTKQVVDAQGNPVPTASRAGFQFTVTCGTTFSQQVTTDATGTATVTNVPAGSCTVSETVPSGFTFVSAVVSGTTANIGNPGTVTVATGQTLSITVTNRQGAATEQVQLFTGCNNVASTYPNGTPTSQVAAGVSPASALIAIWRFDNATQRFAGYSPIPGAPNDLVTLNRADAIFICVNAPATFTRPAI